MKVYLLILLTFLVSCNKKINQNITKVNNKAVNIIDSTPVNKEEFIRKKIDAKFKKEYANFIYARNAVSTFNNKKEFWKTYTSTNDKQIIEVNSYIEDTFYKEIYYTEKDKLIYAEETINYMPINSFTQSTWNCQFYIKNDSVYTIMSLGHGKTEEEEWDENSIITMFNNRKKQYSQLDKNSK